MDAQMSHLNETVHFSIQNISELMISGVKAQYISITISLLIVIRCAERNAQSDQSLCLSLKYFISVKLLA